MPYLLFSLGVVIGALLFYAVCVEPNNIEITRHEINLDSLPAALDGFTVCQVSDMHISRPPRNTAAILDAIRSVKADLYCFTGDQIRRLGGMRELLRILPELAAMASPAFAVLGNAEHRHDVPTGDLVSQMDSGGILTLVNDGEVHNHDGERIQIVGVDDPHDRVDDFARAYANADPDLFTILLCHSPDGIRSLNGYRADIILCGHTHAGQVRLPGVGALWANTRHVRLVHGWYTGNELERRSGLSIGRSHVYVSRGLGTGRFAGRFLCRPELALITLKTRKKV